MPIFEVLGAAIDSAASIMKEGVGKTAETAKEGGDKKSENIKEVSGNGTSIFPDFFKNIQDGKNEDASSIQKKDATESVDGTKKADASDTKQLDSGTATNSEQTTASDSKESGNAARDMARTPASNGSWEGERGNSKWIPDGDYVPPEKSPEGKKPYSNPEKKTWAELLDKYDIDGIKFKDGYPDFSPISKGNVEIEGFKTGGTEAKNNIIKFYATKTGNDYVYTENHTRSNTVGNIKLAKQKGCSPEDVEKWRKENNYTWHECEDKKTMQKVPNEIHANIPHDGGRSQD